MRNTPTSVTQQNMFVHYYYITRAEHPSVSNILFDVSFEFRSSEKLSIGIQFFFFGKSQIINFVDKVKELQNRKYGKRAFNFVKCI